MKHIICLWALVALASSRAAVDRWQRTEDGSQYYIETERKFNWFEALSECARMKMSLVTIDSHLKHGQIYALMKKLFGADDPWFWSGGHDNAVGRRFEWISTGQGFSYTNWHAGEPNGIAEHCVMIFAKSLSWNDASCSMKLGLICEISPMVQGKSEELQALKESCDTQTSKLKDKLKSADQSSNEVNEKLETLKRSQAAQTYMLSVKSDELEALKKTNEQLMNQLFTEQNRIANALVKAYELQTNRTVSNKYFNFVQH